jgi:hypothetical protein
MLGICFTISYFYRKLYSKYSHDGYAPQQLYTKCPINVSNQLKFTFGQSVNTLILDREAVSRFTPTREIAFVVGPTNLSNGAALLYIPLRYKIRGVYARKDVQASKINYPPFPYDENTLLLPHLLDPNRPRPQFSTLSCQLVYLKLKRTSTIL